MTCDEAKGLGASRALNELDAGELRGFEEHLAGCAGCRAEAERDLRTVAALKELDRGDASDVRRERAVAAMKAATGARIPRRRWMAMSVAAAVLMALGASFLISRGGLKIERLDGAAWIYRAAAPQERTEAAAGDRLRDGDRIETQGVVALEGANRLKVLVHRDSRVAYRMNEGAAQLRLEKGAVRVDAPEQPVTIFDSFERKAVVRGSCDARFSAVMGHRPDSRGEPKSEMRIYVNKGEVRFQAGTVTQVLGEGETLTVTDEGTVNVDGPRSDGRKQK